MPMYKIAVVGDKDTVLAFKSLGVDIFPVLNDKEASFTITKLAKENYAVIFVTEQVAKEIPEKIGQFRNQMLPAITLIPSRNYADDVVSEVVKKSVEKAIGADILFRKEGEE